MSEEYRLIDRWIREGPTGRFVNPSAGDEHLMRGNDDGDASQPSYMYWRHTGPEGDFSALSAPAPPFGGPISDVVLLQTTKFVPT